MSALEELIIVGGGEHGRVVIEAARSCPDRWSILGYVSREHCEKTSRALNVSHLGDDHEGARLAYESDLRKLVLGLGGNRVDTVRQKIVNQYKMDPSKWATIVHAEAWVSPTVRLGRGVVLLAKSFINANAQLGDHCVINSAAVIEHDVVLEDFVQVGPAVAIGGGTFVGPGSFLGLGCRIRDHIRIGKNVTVGMGAVVINSISDGQVVVGNPAKAVSSIT